uniref:Uncharacterized protein n=1 Tax=Lepeophtheirus salmonis TaxID=72036 RepID=A0A0K2V5L9_LEPSM
MSRETLQYLSSKHLDLQSHCQPALYPHDRGLHPQRVPGFLPFPKVIIATKGGYIND